MSVSRPFEESSVVEIVLCIFDASTMTWWGFSNIFLKEVQIYIKNCSLYVNVHEGVGLSGSIVILS